MYWQHLKPNTVIQQKRKSTDHFLTIAIKLCTQNYEEII